MSRTNNPVFFITQGLSSQISQDALRNKRRVTKLVLVVIIVFTVCWAPIQFVLLLKAVKMYSTSGRPEDLSKVIFQIVSHVLAYLNR